MGKARKNRVGEKYITNQGYEILIIEYFYRRNCSIQFEDGVIVKNVSFGNIIRGSVGYPPCDRVGEKHTTNQGCIVEVIEYFNRRNCTIRYDNGDVIKDVSYGNLKAGSVKNNNYPSVQGIGYLGDDKYKFTEEEKEVANFWRSMLKRCYNEEFQKRRTTYIGCLVSEDWHNFQNFAKWFHENYNPEYMQDWQLDKDILVRGNKVYSAETCCFVPPHINTLFITGKAGRGEYPIGVDKRGREKFKAHISRGKGLAELIGYFKTPEEAFQAYKTAKEIYIKEVADKWKDKIDNRVYEAMYNYKVEITD